MKKIFFLAALTAASVYAAFISSYPNTATLQSTDLFIVERPGSTNYNISVLQLPGALGLQPTNANLTAWGALAPSTKQDHSANLDNYSGRSTNTFASTNAATTSALGLVGVDGSTITITGGIISAATGGGGNVSGPVSSTSGHIATYTDGTGKNIGDSGHALSEYQLSLGYTAATNSVLGLSNIFGFMPQPTNANLTGWSGIPTNALVDASALGANMPIGTGSTTNFVRWWDGSVFTNTVPWTHEGTATNLTATFTGTLQSFTVTNGPSTGQDVFIHYAGGNGSISYRFSGSAVNTLHFDYQPKWLAGSNNVITNGVLSLTSYGGTNATQLEAAIGENQ